MRFAASRQEAFPLDAEKRAVGFCHRRCVGIGIDDSYQFGSGLLGRGLLSKPGTSA